MKKIFYLCSAIFLSGFLQAQSCGSCSVNIISNDTLTYSVNSGQILCIANNGNFSGNITISGGTVCVTGIFNPKTITISSGVLINNGNVSLNNSISFGSGFQLTNNSGSVFNVNGNLTNSSGTISNSGIINVVNNITNSAAITNSNIINCIVLSDTGTITNTGIINSN